MNTEYFSHAPLLAAAIANTSGPVLELGAGFGSTLMLHGLCGAANRELVTLETDAAWLQSFMNYGREWHTFKHVTDYTEIEEYSQYWGLAFVDHGIALQRGHSVEMLKHCPMVVAHDTCHHFLYNYEPVLSSFKHRYDYKIEGPMTTVVSNIIDVKRLFARFCL